MVGRAITMMEVICVAIVIIHAIAQSATADIQAGRRQQQQQLCDESRCSPDGPAVRFPFRLAGRQPERCGYPGFDLSCREDNQTLLTLPVSVKLLVENIDYEHQFVRVRDPQNCFYKQTQTLNFSSSIFGPGYYNYSFFNCSSDTDTLRGTSSIPCFTGPGYQILAVESFFQLQDLNLLSCTKMYDVLSLPYSTFLPRPIFYWSTPDCSKCVKQSKICGPSATHNQTDVQCFTRPPLPSPPLPNKGQAALKAPVIAGIVVGGVFVLLLLIIALIYYGRSLSRSENDTEIEKFLKDYSHLMPTRYTYSDIKRFTNNFTDKLGQGGYGSVYKGKVSNDTLVAVKMLDNSKGTGDDFVNEVATMGSIHHVNVVRLVGFCADGIYRALVFEFLPNESLDKYISSSDNSGKSQLLNWSKLYDIAVGIAKGIEYLHQGCDQRILHFDIKPHNILLDQKFIPKLCDFGQAKLCAKDQSAVLMTAARGTIGYVAPEVFSRNFGSVSSKSDVYSFGMVLLEMVGGKITKPIAISADTSQTYVPELIYNCLKYGGDMRVKLEDEVEYRIVKKLANVGLWCIQWLPEDRPSMKVVIQMLEADGNWLRMPPDPFASINRMKGISSLQATEFSGGDREVIGEAG
uniref:Protein kinase domain-containing protein n=1 Tax=Kalanchoe fedtschenkoi TaxID=63787 RepID=A0A7N0U2C3_KALFE